MDVSRSTLVSSSSAFGFSKKMEIPVSTIVPLDTKAITFTPFNIAALIYAQ